MTSAGCPGLGNGRRRGRYGDDDCPSLTGDWCLLSSFRLMTPRLLPQLLEARAGKIGQGGQSSQPPAMISPASAVRRCQGSVPVTCLVNESASRKTKPPPQEKTSVIILSPDYLAVIAGGGRHHGLGKNPIAGPLPLSCPGARIIDMQSQPGRLILKYACGGESICSTPRTAIWWRQVKQHSPMTRRVELSRCPPSPSWTRPG